MAEISDDQLRKELKELTGKDAGPVMSSTKLALISKLWKLRQSNDAPTSSSAKHSDPKAAKIKGTSPSSKAKSASSRLPTFAFSSDEEVDDMEVKAPQPKVSVRSSVKKPTPSRRSGTSKVVSSSVPKKSYPTVTSITNGFHSTEAELQKLGNDDIQSQLFELTGTRYPVTDATKSLHVKKLYKLLSNPKKTGHITSADKYKSKASEPMETQFSDSDEEKMEFEPSWEEPVVSPSRPIMVNHSVNTSSFLDMTVPQTPDDDPDCIAMPTPSSMLSETSEQDISSSVSLKIPSPELPSRLPSPNLSSTRRSFVPSMLPPSQPVAATAFNKPTQPSPPRSTLSRRPLRTSAKFTDLNYEVTPKPTNRFYTGSPSNPVSLGRVSDRLPTSRFSAAPSPSSSSGTDYITRYSTGSGRTIDPNPARRDKAVKDADMRKRDLGKHNSYLYSRALVGSLVAFLAFILAYYAFLQVTAPVPLGNIYHNLTGISYNPLMLS